MMKATDNKILAELKTARQERKYVRDDVDNMAIITKNSFDRADKRFDRVDERFDRVESDIKELREGQGRLEKKQDVLQENQERLERGVKSILEVVQENNILLKEFRTHPDRIARLERSVFGSK